MQAFPSVNHLRSFQVIGRHLNLMRAAEELHVTPSALSYQLSILEEQLGVRLFIRTGRGLAFTDAGLELYGDVDESLNRLWAAINRVSKNRDSPTLIVNSYPTFAMRWLMPRFASFNEQSLNVELRVSTTNVTFKESDIDCAITYGDGDYPGFVVNFLREEHLTLVCAPQAITAERPLREPADIARHSWLSTKMRSHDLNLWFAAIEDAPPRGIRQLIFESRNMVIHAALQGLGIAIVDPLMIKDELATGKLIQPFPVVVKGSGSYFLVYRQRDENSVNIAAFRDWLLFEISKELTATPLTLP
jgi:LysR family glycine cleavage system transcriptional activator